MLPAVAPGPEALTQCLILVCDDSVGDAAQVVGLLKNLGYAALTPTTDSRRVMPMLSSSHFDLILLNIKMPHLGGLELIALIRQKHSAAALPMLVITGADSRATRNAAFEATQIRLANEFDLIRYPCCGPAQPMPAIERLLADLPQHLIARRLKAKQLSVPARTMVIADIFEAP